MDEKRLRDWIAQHPDWRVEEGRLVRDFTFTSYAEGVAFALRVALDAEKHNHHPDELAIRWKVVRVAYVTHSAGGLTEKDLEAAARLEAYYCG